MDDFTYNYQTDVNGEKTSNKLLSVSDNPALDANFDSDIDSGQSANNYQYDAIGQLTADEAEGITNIEWRVDGKVKAVHKTVSGQQSTIRFYYDGLGNRIAKSVEPANIFTYYVRDAQGNTMAVYENSNGSTEDFLLKEHHIFGSSRLGLEEKNIQITEIKNEDPVITLNRVAGDKRYELSNHLGNVLSVITDRKLLNSGISGTFKPDVLAYNDYYPKGIVIYFAREALCKRTTGC